MMMVLVPECFVFGDPYMSGFVLTIDAQIDPILLHFIPYIRSSRRVFGDIVFESIECLLV